MKKILAEEKYYTGSIPANKLVRWFKRWSRPNYSKHLAKRKLICGAVPFSWSQPYSSPHGAIKNQQQSDSCGGMAGSYFLEIMSLLKGQSIEVSAKSIYTPIAYPGGGTTETALEEQIGGSGANLEASVPDTAPDGTCTEQFMTDTSWITPALLTDAATRAGYTPMTVALDQTSIAEATLNEGAVIVIAKGQNGLTPGWLSYTPTPPVNNQNIWEHFLCIFGYEQITQPLNLFLNSWGTGVGQGGIQAFTHNYVSTGLVDAFTFVSDNEISAVQQGNTSIWAYLWALFTGKIGFSPSQ